MIIVLVFWCSGVLVFWCSGVLVFWCSGVLVFWCSGVLVRLLEHRVGLTSDEPTAKGAAAPLWSPALAHVSPAHCVGSLTHHFAGGTAIIASSRLPYGPTQALFKTASQCCRVPPR
ncbi:TPA: hypothetical protein ACGSAC_004003, partial [Yersinia enterocolitica]|nr:hypothetical protein [Yersinia enterocolitica]HEA9990016.1 hypothetical protein [Yersinia enterocolitica]